MVTTETSQLARDCNSWIETLRSQREELNRMKMELQIAAASITDKDLLERVDHYENQFEIQLNNVHDLKKNIKLHDQAGLQQHPFEKGMPPELVQDHEKLSFEYADLRRILNDLKSDFRSFLTNHS